MKTVKLLSIKTFAFYSVCVRMLKIFACINNMVSITHLILLVEVHITNWLIVFFESIISLCVMIVFEV